MRPCPSCGDENSDQARFCSHCGVSLGSDDAPRERRVVTVMFCDLVDSTMLGERLDPESLRVVLERFFDAARKIVDRHGGQVEKYLGDAVVAVFGVPTAHEDDAVRAARAAVELQQAMPEVNTYLASLNVTLQVRIGIQTGDVVLDPGNSHVGTIGGDTFNTAARLQSAANPGTILVGTDTAELLDGCATLESVPAIALKGKASPARVFVLTEVIDQTRKRSGQPFVGRTRQLKALRGAFDECVAEQAPVLVTVLGVPGIGKSRIVEQLSSELEAVSTVLTGTTPSYGEDIAYAPLLGLLQTATGVDDADEVVTELRKVLKGLPDSTVVVDRLASLVGTDAAMVAGDVAWALRRFLESLAEEQPVVVIVEDVHFGGDPLLDLLDRVVASVRGSVLIVCTARPELLEQRPSWSGGKARAVAITLGPLGERDAGLLASHLLADADEVLRRQLTSDSEGNPLYLEQLAARISDHRDLDGSSEIPPTLRALVASRLDHLTTLESRVVDLAAVEGRQFQVETLLSLDPTLNHTEVIKVLEHLEHRSLVKLVKGERWQFAHALIQDAASRRTPKEDRATLHVLLADHLVSTDKSADEVIGAHFERAARLRRELGNAGDETLAIERRGGVHYAAAGARAFAAMDLTATADLLGRAVLLLPHVDPGRSDFVPELAVSLMEVGRVAEAERLLHETAAGLGPENQVQQARIQLQVIAAKGVYQHTTDEEVLDLIDRTRQIVTKLQHADDRRALAEAWVVMEYLNYVVGRFSAALDCSMDAARVAESANRAREMWQAGGDMGLYLSGGHLRPARVQGAIESCASESGPIWELARLASRATDQAFAGNAEGFARSHAEWNDHAERHGLEWPHAMQKSAMASAQLELGDFVGAERSIRSGVATMQKLGDVWGASIQLMLPRALEMQGRNEEALAVIERWDEVERPAVLDAESRILGRMAEVIGHRLRGRMSRAETAAREAADLAAATESAIMRATTLEQLAAVVQRNGRPDEARELWSSALAIHRSQENRAGAARVEALLS